MLARSPLAEHAARLSVLLSGSTALGVVDEHSDVDLLVICAQDRADEITTLYRRAGLIDAGSGFFVDLTLPGGKAGHYTLHTVADLTLGIEEMDMDWLWTAASAYVLHDGLNLAEQLKAHVPLTGEALDTLRRGTYIQMRAEAKSLDHAVARGQALAILSLSTALFQSALRCALAVEGYPHPHVKWLAAVAGQTPVGARVLAAGADFLDHIRAPETYQAMDEEDHAVVRLEKRMRRVLVNELRARGVDAPWLVEWWKHIDG